VDQLNTNHHVTAGGGRVKVTWINEVMVCLRKQSYSKKDAQTILNKWTTGDIKRCRGKKVHIYQCRVCNKWHIGTWK